MAGRVADADIRLLRIFVAVVECGGFAAAQALLNVSESTISTHMHDLETRLGMRLCERGRSGFRLTGDGEAIFRATRDLLASLDRFQDHVAARKREMSGELTVGLPDNILTHPDFPLAAAIEHFYGRVNMVELTLHTMTPRDLERGVLEGNLQIAIIPRHRKIAGLNYEKLLREVNYFYCGRRHPLFQAAKPNLDIETIAAAGLIGRGYLSKFDQKFFGASPHRATVFSMEAAAALVLSGRFGGFLPAHYAERWVEMGEMKALRPDILTYAPDFDIVTRKSGVPSLPAKAFIAQLRAEALKRSKAEPGKDETTHP
jgi:LysR family transcriptional regulator, transcriptional activator for bauABCD operon